MTRRMPPLHRAYIFLLNSATHIHCVLTASQEDHVYVDYHIMKTSKIFLQKYLNQIKIKAFIYGIKTIFPVSETT